MTIKQANEQFFYDENNLNVGIYVDLPAEEVQDNWTEVFICPISQYCTWNGTGWDFGEQDIRDERSIMLSDLDVIVANPLRWSSFTAEEQENISTYRQELLDITSQAGFPASVTWPIKPEVLS